MANSENIGTWKTGELLDPWPPEWLEEFKLKVDTLAKWMIASLEIINVMLDVIKTFLVGFSDPISALIKALVKEIQKIMKDLKQIGLYFTSDRKLLKWPFKELVGGYPAAEKRMVGRLTDRTDKGRPDVSPNSLMIGFMFYLSADPSAIYSTIAAINKLLSLFSFNISGNAFAPISNLRASYTASDPEYTPTFGEDVFSSPEEVEVSFVQVNTLTVSKSLTIPLSSAPNFIIEVSVLQNGLPIFITRQDPNKSAPTNSKNKIPTKVSPIMQDIDGTIVPFVLFGGADRFSYASQFNYTNATDTEGNLKKGFKYIHTFVPQNNSQPIPIEKLKIQEEDKTTYLLQRSFVIGEDSGRLDLNFGPEKRFNIKIEDLPKNIKIEGTGSDLEIVEDVDNPPTTYYFRVIPTAKFHPDFPFGATRIFPYNIQKNDDDVLATTTVAFGLPSSPYRLIVPRPTTALYQASLESALLCLLLSRPDLDTDDREVPFLDEDKTKATSIFGISPEKFFSKTIPIKKFRLKINSIVKRKTREIMVKSGPLTASVEEFIVNSSAELRDFKWSDYDSALPEYTLRGSFGLDNKTIGLNDLESGVGANTKSLVADKGLELEPKIRKKISLSTALTTQVFALPRYTVFMDKKDYDDQLAFAVSAMNSFTGIGMPAHFRQSQLEKVDYLLNGVKKDDNGDVQLVKKQGAPDQVLLMDRSDFIRSKKNFASMSLYNGNQALVYSNLRDIVVELDLPPNVLRQSNPIYTARDILLDHSGEILLRQAAFVLNIATSSVDKRSESEWDMVRMGDNGVMLFIEQFMNMILNSVQAILDGIQGIIDAILRFIDFCQQRINEVQNLIRKINALIQAIGLFDIPKASILFFASNGTDGVLSDLLTSEDKPVDAGTSIGFAGMGLIPIPLANVIIDIFFPDTDINGLVEETISGDF